MNVNDLQSIWRIPAFIPYIQPPLTDEAITAAETKMGYPLPKDYIDLLRTQNGGYISYTFGETAHDRIIGIGPNYPTITAFEWLKEMEEISTVPSLDGLFPFDGDGHWNICLDYRRNKIEPEITCISLEAPYHEDTIASCFKEYLQKLTITTEDEFVCETDQSLEELVQQLSIALNIEFTIPDTPYGWPFTNYRAMYEERLIAVYPNKLPRAYVPREYAEQGKPFHEGHLPLTNETGLKYSKVPESAMIILSYANDRVEMYNDLRDKGFKLKLIEEYY